MMQGWPREKRLVGNLSGVPVARDDTGNLSGWPNIARRLDRKHPINRNLVGWWPMDEGGGTRIRDLSIYGNHGTLANMANPPTASSGWGGGPSQRELAFDAIDDLCTVPHSASISQAFLSTTFTMMGWVYLKTLSNYGFLGFKGTGGAPQPVQCYFEPGAGGYWILIVGNGSSWGGPTSATGKTIMNRWHHIAAVRNGATGYMYIDGALSGTPAGGFVSPTDSGGVYCMFSRTPSFYSPTGSMQHSRVYGRALSASEIAQIYADRWIGSIGGIT